jgi:hypothetical protein
MKCKSNSYPINNRDAHTNAASYSPQGWPCGHHNPGRYAGKKVRVPTRFSSGSKNLLQRFLGLLIVELTWIFTVVIINLSILAPKPIHSLTHSSPESSVTLHKSRGACPRLVTKRSKVKPFIKTINYNHLMPTRYTLEWKV